MDLWIYIIQSIPGVPIPHPLPPFFVHLSFFFCEGANHHDSPRRREEICSKTSLELKTVIQCRILKIAIKRTE